MCMNFFKRATTSIIRRPGKTVILLLLVFILGSVIAGAISVEGAISNTDANLRRNMQPIVSIDFDWMAFDNSIDWATVDHEVEDPWNAREFLTAAHVREIGALSYVDFYDYMIRAGFETFELQEYIGGGFIHGMEGRPHWQQVQGTSRPNMVQIEEGIIELIHGNSFSDGDFIAGGERVSTLISETFANHNNLSIGSVFELSSFIPLPTLDDSIMWGPEMYEEENLYAVITMEFEVIGLFDIPADNIEQHGQEYWDRMRNLNIMYLPNWAIEDFQRRTAAAQRSAWDAAGLDMPSWMNMDEDREVSVTPLFVIENPAYIEDFRAAGENLLPEFYIFEDMSSAFDDIASSMETMQTIANWILYVSIGATLLILSLLITLFLRDRRYEMGVYLALGEKKGKIVTQILMEVLVTSFVAITLSVFVGNIISSTVSRNMLMNELMAETNDDHIHRWGIFEQIGIPTNNLSVDEMMEQFDVSLTAPTIGLFYVIGLGAVVLSTIAPVMYVVTLNPKKVLM